jgi:phosphinothricin acetyltransferase
MIPIIRLAQENDAGQVRAIYAPACLHTPASFEIEAPTEEEMRRRILKTLERYAWLVCEAAGEVVGYAYASGHRERPAYRWSADVTIYVGVGRRRSGIGRGLYTSLLQLLKLQGYRNAYAGIALPNPGSVGLHEAMGFQPVGVYHGVGYKLGAWHDVGWWELSLLPRTGDPSPPHAFPAVDGSPACTAALRAGAAFFADRRARPH